eukprot:scpid21194/ scgid7532/ Actin
MSRVIGPEALKSRMDGGGRSHRGGLPLVFDIGSHCIFLGTAGQPLPYLEIPPVVAQHRNAGQLNDDSPIGSLVEERSEYLLGPDKRNEYFVGEQAKQLLRSAEGEGSEYVARYPLANQRVINWTDLEKIWIHGMHHNLGVVAEDHPILMNVPPYLHAKDHRKMLEILFESLNGCDVSLHDDAALALLSRGVSSGMVLALGHSTAEFVPVEEGFTTHHFAMPMDDSMTGIATTRRLKDLLAKSPHDFTKEVVGKCHLSDEYAQALKEDYSMVAQFYNHQLCDFDESWKRVLEEKQRHSRVSLGPRMFWYDNRQQVDPRKNIVQELKLKDREGKECELMFGPERMAVYESLFDARRLDPEQMYVPEEETGVLAGPGRTGKTMPVPKDGLAGRITARLEVLAEYAVNGTVLRNLVVTGGNACAPGFADRLGSDLLRYSRENGKKVWTLPRHRVLSSPNPRYDVWKGGSILATHPSMSWVSKRFYMEHGAANTIKQKLWLRE